jgi:hypothetical protein
VGGDYFNPSLHERLGREAERDAVAADIDRQCGGSCVAGGDEVAMKPKQRKVFGLDSRVQVSWLNVMFLALLWNMIVWPVRFSFSVRALDENCVRAGAFAAAVWEVAGTGLSSGARAPAPVASPPAAGLPTPACYCRLHPDNAAVCGVGD